jgi:hypothetical protein
MRSLLENAARARVLIEGDIPIDEVTKQALRNLVNFTFAACPGPNEPVATKSLHTLYTHPNGRCYITVEPDDLRTPYYEWRRVYGSWALYNRHCWKADALRIASGRPLDSTPPVSSRPPPTPVPPAPPSVQVMPLEEQIRQVLLVDKDRGEYIGTMVSAVRCLEGAGFDLDVPEVREALWRVTRGTSFHEEDAR